MESKKCTKCGEVKPYGMFGKDKSRKDGIAFNCKECEKLRQIEYAFRNPEKRKACYKKYRESNREIVRASQIRHRENNYEKIKSRKIQHRKNNKATYAIYEKKYRDNNRLKVRRSSLDYFYRNKDRITEITNSKIEGLHTSYLTSRLRKDGFSLEHIKAHPELIEIKRLIIKTKRL